MGGRDSVFDVMPSLVRFLALLPALVVHEVAHGYAAYRMGDMTAKRAGRLTLNPLAHLDPIGTLMILIGWFGWAKPVPLDPYTSQDAGKFMVISAACGPLSNLAQGALWGLGLRAYWTFVSNGNPNGDLLLGFLAAATLLNFVLAFFNLVPLGPLDGHYVWPYFLPYSWQVRYHRFNNQYGMFALIALVFLGRPLLYLMAFVPAETLSSMVSGVPCWEFFYRAVH
jgi:Zn-dependent protease